MNMNSRSPADTFAKTFLLCMLTIATINLTLFKLAGFDLWLHMKTGQLVLEQGKFLRVDPFSALILNTKWIAHEWLFGVIFYLIYQLTHSWGLIIAKVLLVVALEFVVLSSQETKLRRYWLSAPLFLIAILFSRFRLLLRPHLFSLLFLALYYFAFQRWRKGQNRYALIFPLVMIFWANVHAGSVFGLVFLSIFFIGELFVHILPGFAENPLPRKQITSLGLILFVTTLAALLNPYGYHTLLLPFTLKSMQQIYYLKLIEWQPFTMADKPLLFGYLTIVSLWVMFRFKRLSPGEILLYCFYSYLLLSARRGVPYWAFLTIPLLEKTFGGAEEEQAESSIWPALAASQIIGLTMVTISLVIAIKPTVIFQFGVGSRFDKLPKAAADFIIEENVQGKLFNSYRLGGYLIWRLAPQRKVFIDGRASLYQKVFNYRSTFNLDQLIDYYDIDYMIVDYQTNMPFSLDTKPDSAVWALVFWDDAARIYIKRRLKNAKTIINNQYVLIKPTDNQLSFLLTESDKYPQIEQEILRANAKSPNNFLGQIFLCGLRYAQKRPEEARRIFNNTFKKKPYRTSTYFVMANLLHSLKQEEEALVYLKKGLKKKPDNWAGYQLLGSVYASLDKTDQAIEAFKKGLKIKNDSFLLNYQLGYTYFKAEEFETALDFLERAYQLNPDDNSTWQTLAQVYTYLGDYEKAKAVFERYQNSLPPAEQPGITDEKSGS